MSRSGTADVTPRGTARVEEPLRGVRIALLEARMEGELASLVRRHGGEPVCVPALREVERDCAGEVARACRAVTGGAVVVMTTGAGVERLLRVASERGLAGELRAGLGRSSVVCRGPKPAGVLKREGLRVDVRVAPPHTTRELLAALGALDVAGRDVVFVHDGGGSREAVDALSTRGAREVIEVQPYAWALPEDLTELRGLVDAIAAARVDAVAFTTQAQARHLFSVADSIGARDAMARAMTERVVVAAVGPTCARALRQLGASPHVVPDSPKMGAMVMALAARFARAR